MRSSPLINTGQAWDYSGAIIRIKNSTMSFDTQPPKLLRLNQELRENTVRQREGAEGTRPYLDGGGFVKTNVLDIVHDLWITLKGLQKSATRFGNGPLLTFLLQVIHKDIVILFSLWGKKKKTKNTKMGTMLTPYNSYNSHLPPLAGFLRRQHRHTLCLDVKLLLQRWEA